MSIRWAGTDAGDVLLMSGPKVAPLTPARLFSGLTIVVVEHDALLSIAGERRALTGPTVVILSPYEVHAWLRVGAPSRMLAIHLSPTIASRVAARLGMHVGDAPWSERRLGVVPSPALAALVASWHARAGASDQNVVHELLDPVTEAYASCDRHRRFLSFEHRAVSRVLQHLHADRPTTVNVARVIELAQLSPAHFTRVFRAGVGLPPIGYYKQVRLAWSRERLAASESSRVIAHASGFADQSHFTRDFARSSSVPPGRFANCLLTDH